MEHLELQLNSFGHSIEMNPPVIKAQCIGNKIARQFCINPKCQNAPIFTCFTAGCKCQALHEVCNKCDISYTTKMLKLKQIDPTFEIRQEIISKFQDLIDQLSLLRNNFLSKVKDVEEMLNLNQLSPLQKLFLTAAERNCHTQKLCGKQALQIWNLIGDRFTNSFPLISKLKVKIDQFNIQQINSIKSLEKQTEELYLNFLQEQKDLLNKKKLNKKKCKIPSSESFESQSSIIQTAEQSQTLLKAFNKQVKSIELLFKASQNDFSLNKYFQICGPVQNTLIVCETTGQKIICGFSPISHEYTGKGYEVFQDGEFVNDTTKSSFLLSLSNGDRFQLKNEFKAIYRSKTKKFISFGADELKICNEANKLKQSCTIINKCYRNLNYKKNDKNSFLKFNGSENQSFTLNQWEVWKIDFQE